ncbi:hypothetical protein B296_00053621, partial [Ensete ventricosum]
MIWYCKSWLVSSGTPNARLVLPSRGWYYRLCTKVAGTWTTRYRAVPSKIDRRRSIEGEIDRRQSIEGEKGKKKKRKRRKKEKRSTYFPAPSLPARRRCPRVARAPSPLAGRGRFLSRARRQNVSPRGEKGRGD